MTTTYRIHNIDSGHVLGTYEGATPLDAYRAMMADAGHPTEESAQSAGATLAEIPSDIAVEMAWSYTIVDTVSEGTMIRGEIIADSLEDATDAAKRVLADYHEGLSEADGYEPGVVIDLTMDHAETGETALHLTHTVTAADLA